MRTIPATIAKAQIAALFLCALLCPAMVRAQSLEWCEFFFNACPGQFQGDTIRVPEKVIAMGTRVHSCEGYLAADPGDTTPPSIMFVIDNSGSMSGLGSGPNDQMGSRFSVTLALLDEIYARAPNARVGVAVFQNILYFDHRDDSFFTQLAGNVDGVADQSYIPLTRLNASLPGGTTGIEKLKEAMAIDTTRARMYNGNMQDYVHLKYVPRDTSDLTYYTNINVGFMAAAQAFAAAPTPPEHQFVIFFSDGVPQGPMQGGLAPYYFSRGIDVPATFTVFFTPTGRAPDSLRVMTDNIAANGYSASNPSSNLWAIATSHNALLSLIMDNVMGSIFFSTPSSIAITGIQVSDSSTMHVDSYFVFSEPVPLQPVITPFDLRFNFRTTDQSTGGFRDTTVSIAFHVRRDPAAPNAAPAGIEYVCWPRPTLQLAYGGQPVTEVRADMAQLEVRFMPGDPRATAVTTAIRSSADSESVSLTSRGAYWSSSFPRTTGSVGTKGDGTLVHRSVDSIIVMYRNPLLPLDTARLAVPVAPDTGGIPVVATLRDTSGDGHLDRIELTWTDATPIRPNMPSIDSFIASLQLTLPDGTPVSLHAVAVVADLANKTIHVILRENTGARLETQWRQATVRLGTVPMGQGGEPMYVTRVLDGAGPVIERVELHASRGAGGDSLRVVFSEPVDCARLTAAPPESLFIYYDKSSPGTAVLTGATYAGSCPSAFASEVTIVLQSVTFRVASWEDRIGLPGGAIRVSDSAGNHPPAGGQSVAIEGGGKNSIQLTVSPSPASPDREIDARVRQAYANVAGNQTRGMIIGVFSKIPLKAISSGPQGPVYGSADIYDAVGNLVQEKLPVSAADQPGVYGVYWSVRNRNARGVGNGAYLAMVTTTAVTGEKLTKRVKVGVRR